MNKRIGLALAAMACVGVSACSGGGEPKGQVVAKVGKDEITVLDLQSEMAGFKAPNAQVRKAAEQQALQAIIQRKILFDAAKKKKMDKSPEYNRQRERLDEALLVRSWQDQLVKAIPPPSADEIQKFIADHPDLYGARKRFIVDGLRFAMPADPSILRAIQPLNTMPEVTALLNSRNIQFTTGEGTIDALAVDPRLVEQLVKLPPGAVFFMPQGQQVLVGQVRETKVEPAPTDLATRHATAYLKSQRTQEALSRQFGSVVAAGMKDVKYNKAYEPPKPAAKGAAAAAQPAPAAPAAAAPAAKP